METLVVIGLVFIPVFVTMEALHRQALERGQHSAKARYDALSEALDPSCAEAPSACAVDPLVGILPAPTGLVRDGVQPDRDIALRSCRSGPAQYTFACQEPADRPAELDVERVLCQQPYHLGGRELCASE
ncbi:MAG: hypothetical protein AAGF12_07635 [Myxococcota bacterium]